MAHGKVLGRSKEGKGRVKIDEDRANSLLLFQQRATFGAGVGGYA